MYKLADDPGETKNLYFVEPDIAKKLKAMLDQTIAGGRSAPPR